MPSSPLPSTAGKPSSLEGMPWDRPPMPHNTINTVNASGACKMGAGETHYNETSLLRLHQETYQIFAARMLVGASKFQHTTPNVRIPF